jgi:hypothetical protein
MGSAEENNKALVRRFVEEVLNAGNLDAVDELLAIPPTCTSENIPSTMLDE